MESVSLDDGGWVFDNNFSQRTQWIHDYLLDLLLSEDSCKEREFGTKLWGKVLSIFSEWKVLYSLVSKMQYFTLHKTHNIIKFPCVLLESPNVLLGKLARHRLKQAMHNAHFWWYWPQIWKGICPVLWLDSIVFQSTPDTATIICIQSKPENLFSEKKALE